MSFIPTLFLLLLSLEPSQNWSGISGCGDYQVQGVARQTHSGLVILVNEKSQSEFTIHIPIPNEAKLAPYVNKALFATVTFEKQPLGKDYQGFIKDIGPRIPNPLSPKDSGIKMLSEAKCKK